MAITGRWNEASNPEPEQYHDNSDQLHFHIRWKAKETIDWECFSTREEAMSRALELAHPGENFTIEEVTANCPMRGAGAAANGD